MIVYDDDLILAGCICSLRNWTRSSSWRRKSDWVPTTIVKYNDSELTCEVDPRHPELIVTERGLQSTRTKTRSGDVKSSTSLVLEELDPDGQQVYHNVSVRLTFLTAYRTDIVFVCKEYIRAGEKTNRTDLTRLQRIGRYLLHTSRVVWGLSLLTEERVSWWSIHSPILTQQVARKRGAWLRVGQLPLTRWPSTHKVTSLDSAISKCHIMERCASEIIDTNLNRCCSCTRTDSSQSKSETRYFCLQ